jgi:hypothetical protein
MLRWGDPPSKHELQDEVYLGGHLPVQRKAIWTRVQSEIKRAAHVDDKDGANKVDLNTPFVLLRRGRHFLL